MNTLQGFTEGTVKLVKAALLATLSLQLLAQDRPPEDFRVYMLIGSDDQSCVFTDSTKWKSEVQNRATEVTGELFFVKGKIAKIDLRFVDDSGDWSAHEIYHLAEPTRLVSMERTISVRDGDEVQSWAIRNGRAVKQSSKRVPSNVDFVPDLPVITNPDDFPFWPLIKDIKAVRAKGMACTAK